VRGDGGPLGQQAVPTVVRTFGPRQGVTLDAIAAGLDDEARRQGLAVSTHRDGHCAVTPAEDGQVVHVWRTDTTQNEVRYRAVYFYGREGDTVRCIGEAGPPGG